MRSSMRLTRSDSRRARACRPYIRSCPNRLAAASDAPRRSRAGEQALACGMSWARISTSSSRPGRPRKKTSTVSSKLNSQNGSLQVLRVQHVRPVAEGMAVLVVRVDQEDAQIRPHLQHLAQDDGDAARLADARAAEQREVLAQHVLDLDAGADRGVLLQPADVDRIGARRVVDQAQPLAAEQLDCVADDGVLETPRWKRSEPALALLELAEQIDAGGQLAASFACRFLPAAIDVGDHADDRGSPLCGSPGTCRR